MTRDLLAARSRATPDRTALIDAATGEATTYADLDSRVDGLAARLAGLGVDPGDRVGAALDTSVAAAEAIHAVWRRGATLVGLNARLPDDAIAGQAARAGADALLVDADRAGAAASVDAPAAAIGPAEGVRRLSGLPADPVDPAAWGRDDTAVLLFTSGTTGEPKPVPLTAGNLLASAVASAFRLGIRPDDRWHLCLPVYHMGGLAPLVRSALYGTAVVVEEGFDAEATPAAMRERGATGVSLVPTMLRRVLDAGADLPVRFVLLGGAPAPPDLIAACERRDVPVYPTYGMTEAASQVTTATPAEAFAHPGTVGRPLLGTEVTVVDGAGDPLPEGERGEIVVAGPTVTPGYDDRDRGAFGPHGFHTGDLGYLEDGRLWVVGRLDDLIVTGGENVSPREVADALRGHPGVEDAAVIGLPDPEWGERVAALVVGDADPGDLRDHCRGRLADYAVPKTIAFADALPRTDSGTVDRAAVRDRLR